MKEKIKKPFSFKTSRKVYEKLTAQAFKRNIPIPDYFEGILKDSLKQDLTPKKLNSMELINVTISKVDVSLKNKVKAHARLKGFKSFRNYINQILKEI